MQLQNIFELEGMTLPAGRNTKVFVGPGQTLTAENFVQGYVTIFPNGGIPEHAHENEETYTILSGTGVVTVDGEEVQVKAGDCIFMPRNHRHSLKNTGDTDMIMLFVYSPANIVDHWEQEQAGTLK